MKPSNPIPDIKNVKAFQILEQLVNVYYEGFPLVIGITGAGGAGKTTYGNNIVKYYGSDNCVSIDLDDYLISRMERAKLEISGYNPNANKIYEIIEDISDLVKSNKIKKPKYDHSTGNILEDEEISSKSLIVIEGVTTLYEGIRELNKISFFLDASDETQIKSRIERDVKERGYTIDEAIKLHENLKSEYKKYIEPTKNFASVVFKVDPDYIMHPFSFNDNIKRFLK